tara:strand:- start:631 stop:2172 length:1542 start_codon:yes stop_codon:yes gene_type:complete
MSYFPDVMIQNPLAFIALLALIVPLVLHLISKSQPKQVKFANIALIDSLQPKSMRQIRLTEAWLLLLRLLLLICSVLLLADLFLTKALIKNDEVHVVTADWLNQSNDTQRQQLIDNSLNQPIYLLAGNTELITDKEVVEWQQQLNVIQHQNTLKNLTSFSQLLAAETRIKLFVTDRAAQYKLNDIKPQITIANSVDWQIQNLASNRDEQYPHAMNVVIIYDEDRYGDLKYFQQAFALIKQQVAPALKLSSFDQKTFKNTEHYQQILRTPPDWLFYLSTTDLDQETVKVLSTSSNLFVDAQQSNENTLFSNANAISINKSNAALLYPEALFYQRGTPLNIGEQLSEVGTIKNTEILWQLTQPNGISLPMLTKSSIVYQSAKRESIVYQLYSRFTSSWSNLLLLKQFPLFLQDLLFQQWQEHTFENKQTLLHDQISQRVKTLSSIEQASLGPSSIEKGRFNFKHVKDLAVTQQRNESYWTEILTFLLILLWTIERIVSEIYRSKSKTKSLDQVDA